MILCSLQTELNSKKHVLSLFQDILQYSFHLDQCRNSCPEVVKFVFKIIAILELVIDERGEDSNLLPFCLAILDLVKFEPGNVSMEHFCISIELQVAEVMWDGEVTGEELT